MENQNKDMDVMIQISNVKKRYRLGQIGGGTLQADLQSWWARMRGKEDPNTKIGADQRSNGENFMALNGIDLTIYKGEAVGIIGRNGAGKSTLLKLLSRVTAPTEGEIDIYGRIASMLEVGTGFSPEMTGRENVYMNGAILGMTKAEIDAKMEDIIEFSEVREFIDTPVKRYSSGMYVKLAFSVAAHLDSEIMIMDEVLAVGDMAFQKKCLDKMRNAAKEDGKTVLYVSHNMSTIRQLCEKCIVLDKGKVIFEGDVETAINEYLCNTMDLQKCNDFSKLKRDNSVTSLIKVESLKLLNKDNFLEYGKKLKFVLTFSCGKNINDLVFRFNFHTNDGNVFATALTKTMVVKKGQRYQKIFEIDTSSFAPSQYRIRMTAFEPDYKGQQIRHDCIEEALFFEVYDTNPEYNMEWDVFWWGNYIMPHVLEIKER